MTWIYLLLVVQVLVVAFILQRVGLQRGLARVALGLAAMALWVDGITFIIRGSSLLGAAALLVAGLLAIRAVRVTQ